MPAEPSVGRHSMHLRRTSAEIIRLNVQVARDPLVITPVDFQSTKRTNTAALQDFITAETWERICCNSRLTSLVIFLERHISEPITLAEAARAACMQRTAFSRFFRRAAGIGYRKFLHALRLNRASLLIRTSDESITEIAGAVGYSDISTFERVFKEYTGCCPREFRKNSVIVQRNIA